MILAPGAVLHLYFNDIGTPKNKFGVLVTADPVRFFLINTRISNFVHHTPAARRAQIDVDVASHPFLNHDSWLDCTEWYDAGLSGRTLLNFVRAKPKAIVGSISDDVRRGIVTAVAESKLLSPNEKDEIVQALRGSLT